VRAHADCGRGSRVLRDVAASVASFGSGRETGTAPMNAACAGGCPLGMPGASAAGV